jgi:hypothetical protein
VEASNIKNKFKRGDEREDGMVFYKYSKKAKNGEYWITKEKLLKYNQNANAAQKKRYNKNKEKYLNLFKQKYSLNKEKFIKKSKEYREKNLEKVRIIKIKYRRNNLTKHKEWENNYRKNNPSFLKTRKIWKQKNKLRISFKEKERVKRKMQNDPIFRIGRNIRSLIRCSFRNIGLRKNSKTASILGCSIQFFKQYIESKFKEKMSWENKNLWHLDHIIPISLAKSEEELIKLNHYTNFQPLWAAENIRKSNKIPLGCLIPI